MSRCQPIFLSGPHGGGKTTLLKTLTKASGLFFENDFDIDFTIDFPHLPLLSPFERCLMRLYHRVFVAQYARELARRRPGKCILTNRTVYDSEAYIHVYRNLGWVTALEFQKLSRALRHFPFRPYAIVLNPSYKMLSSRLKKRKRAGTRSMRDKIFVREDTPLFIRLLRNYYKKFNNNPRVLYLEQDREQDIQKIFSWIRKINKSSIPSVRL